MKDSETPALLAKAEQPAVHVLNAGGHGRVVLVCEHASPFIPASLGDLGLSVEALLSHAAWDIGALDVARNMMTALDAPLVASRVSRLVYDCNRPPKALDAIAERSERFAIPGNVDLSATARDARVREVYQPFRNAVSELLGSRGKAVILVTVHSFTPVYMGQARDIELGLLHDADDRLAKAMMRVAAEHTTMRTGLNAPYSAADGVTHTLREHAIPAGIPNVMIEIRNDLIATPESAQRIAADLVAMLTAVIGQIPSNGDGTNGKDCDRTG